MNDWNWLAWLKEAEAATDPDTGSNDDEHDCLVEAMERIAETYLPDATHVSVDALYNPATGKHVRRPVGEVIDRLDNDRVLRVRFPGVGVRDVPAKECTQVRP